MKYVLLTILLMIIGYLLLSFLRPQQTKVTVTNLVAHLLTAAKKFHTVMGWIAVIIVIMLVLRLILYHSLIF